MTAIYTMVSMDDDICKTGVILETDIESNWFSEQVMSEEEFENKLHVLSAVDAKERNILSENLQDIVWVHPAVWAFSDKASALVDLCYESGARVARNVQIKGKKKFQFLYPAPILDILNHDKSDLIINDALGKGREIISWLRIPVFNQYTDEYPLFFQVLLKGSKEFTGPSGKAFVTQEFVDIYNDLGLFGAEFIEVTQ